MSSRLLPEDFDIVSTGWLRFLPEPAFEPYLAIWLLARHPEGPRAGDLDELGAQALYVEEHGGLDAPYEPEPDEGDDGAWAARWEMFRAEAAERGLPMATPRDAIEFMRQIGLIERCVEDGLVYWRPVVPVPLAEDILNLDEDTLKREAAIRWHHAFQQAENAAIGWLVGQRGDGRTTERRITMAELASHLELDIDELRHGLAGALDTGDITAVPHPEHAEPDEALLIVVDWIRFDQERVSIRFAGGESQ